MLRISVRFAIEPRAVLALGIFWNARQEFVQVKAAPILFRCWDVHCHLSVLTLRFCLVKPPRQFVVGVPAIDPPAEHVKGEPGIPHLDVTGVDCPCPLCERSRGGKKGDDSSESP